MIIERILKVKLFQIILTCQQVWQLLLKFPIPVRRRMRSAMLWK